MSARISAVTPMLAAALGAWLAQSPSPSNGVSRTYYVAADEIAWSYAPSGSDQITGEPFDEIGDLFVARGPDRIGSTYRKALYREYSDSTFSALKPRPPEWEHLGLLGPVLRAAVGDTIKVVFKNNARFPYSVHPHGVFYHKDSEGAPYDDGTDGGAKADDAVPPGQVHTYVWPVTERAGPGPADGSSVLWMYHSHTDEVRDVNSGLVGPMIVSARATARPDGSPRDVDREFVAAFLELDENASWYIEENIQEYAGDPASVTFDCFVVVTDEQGRPRVQGAERFFEPFCVSNFMETINGFVFGNGPPMTMRAGERVRWYLFGSTNFEMHSPHWHGNTVTIRHHRTDMAALLPMDMTVADMTPDNPGTWLLHCHVGPHLIAGMQTRYRVME